MSQEPDLRKAVEKHQLGLLEEAAQLYEQIIEQYPRDFDANHLLGALLLTKKELEQARHYLEQSLAIEPNNAAALYHMGNLCYLTGDLFTAAEYYESALRNNTSHAGALNNYGTVLSELGRKEEAIQTLSRAITMDPRNARAHKNLGQLLRLRGRHQEALVFLGEAVTLDQTYSEAYDELARVLTELGFLKETLSALERSATSQPDNVSTLIRLGDLYVKGRLLQDAIDSYSRALELNPDNPAIHNNLGLALGRQGRIAESIQAHRQAFSLRPYNAMYHSNLLLCLNYLEGMDKEDLYSLHRDWENLQTRELTPISRTDPCSSDRIRIGYLSPDFRSHPVSSFFLPLLSRHNSEEFEVFCFSDVEKEDRVTESLKAWAEHWVPIWDKSDFEISQLIAGEGIDILVDLAGHTGDNRLKVFARKPAPIQVSWLGYPNTTGLSTIDYRITDEVADPPGEEAYHSEELVRLEHGFHCFSPPTEYPDVGETPAASNGYVTFGSFNNLAKLNKNLIELWASVLKRVPYSRLLLKSNFMDDERSKERLLDAFRAHRIAEHRISILRRFSSKQEHLDAYNQMDIALDTFPYNGTTTSFEALWMGVPVITLKGDRHVARVTASILEHAGLSELIAASKRQYINRADQLAKDLEKLQRYRATLRETLASSELMNPAGFADKMERFYRRAYSLQSEDSLAANIVIE